MNSCLLVLCFVQGFLDLRRTFLPLSSWQDISQTETCTAELLWAADS